MILVPVLTVTTLVPALAVTTTQALPITIPAPPHQLLAVRVVPVVIHQIPARIQTRPILPAVVLAPAAVVARHPPAATVPLLLQVLQAQVAAVLQRTKGVQEKGEDLERPELIHIKISLEIRELAVNF